MRRELRAELADLVPGDRVIVRDDNGAETEREVKYAPWQLGHGAWVIGLKGISGGYRLDRVVRVVSLVAMCLFVSLLSAAPVDHRIVMAMAGAGPIPAAKPAEEVPFDASALHEPKVKSYSVRADGVWELDDQGRIVRQADAEARKRLLAEYERQAAKPARVEVAAGVHRCPNCGSGDWLVQHRRTADGWHSHVCGFCRTEFWHRDSPPVRFSPAPVYGPGACRD